MKKILNLFAKLIYKVLAKFYFHLVCKKCEKFDVCGGLKNA